MSELGLLSPLFRPAVFDSPACKKNKENVVPRTLGPAKRVPIHSPESGSQYEVTERAVEEALRTQRMEYLKAIENRDQNIEQLKERQQVPFSDFLSCFLFLTNVIGSDPPQGGHR
jgi:hypothetical protein